MWGQYYQSKGELGERPQGTAPNHLLALADRWNRATDTATRTAIWREMLQIHAEQVYAIGVLSEAPQPVVVSKLLRNVPDQGVWAYDPGAHFGIHRIDEFYFEEPFQQVVE